MRFNLRLSLLIRVFRSWVALSQWKYLRAEWALIKLNLISRKVLPVKSTLIFRLLRRLKLLFRGLSNFRKLRTTLIKKTTCSPRLKWDHILQFTVRSTQLRIPMSIARLTRSNLPLFCFKDLWEVVQNRTWCSKEKKRDLILLLNCAPLKSGKQPQNSKRTKHWLRTIKKELLMVPLRHCKQKSSLKLLIHSLRNLFA